MLGSWDSKFRFHSRLASAKIGFMSQTPTFWVRDIPIYGDVVLSPMAGYSDVPYRAVCRAYGSAMSYTEFVPVEALMGRQSRNRFWQRLDRAPGEYPLVFQIFGNNTIFICKCILCYIKRYSVFSNILPVFTFIPLKPRH